MSRCVENLRRSLLSCLIALRVRQDRERSAVPKDGERARLGQPTNSKHPNRKRPRRKTGPSGQSSRAQQCRQPAVRLAGPGKECEQDLLIKKKAPAFETLIKDISKTADDGEKQLDRLAKDDPAFDLHETRLPPGEVASREAQSKEQEHTLLAAKDQTFEFDLLLAQAQALDYTSHLAGVAAENCTMPDQERAFKTLETDLNGLYMQAVAQMRGVPRVTDRRDRDKKKKPRNS